MNKMYTLLTAALLSTTAAVAQNVVDAGASDSWVGYMNVFDLPEDGGGYQFGSSWEVPAVQTTLDEMENTITLQPNFNTYEENPDDPYWVNADTETGNKDMEGLTFVEPGETFNGVDLKFEGTVLEHTLDETYAAQFFIKALDPDAGFSDVFGGSKVFDLPESGTFAVEATGAELEAGLIIQYGFLVRGRNASPLAEDSLGSVVIGSAYLSTTEIENEPTISVYPNPTTDFIAFTNNTTVDTFTILDITGQAVITGTNADMIDVSTLENGVYFVRFDYMDRERTLKFIKK